MKPKDRCRQRDKIRANLQFSLVSRLCAVVVPCGDLLAAHTYTNGDEVVSETYSYDMLGNRVSTTDAHGNTVYKTYDPLGNVVAEWGVTYPVRYTYDTAGRRTSLTTFRDAGGSRPVATDGDTTTWTYDPATGNCLSKTYADNSQVLYTYTPDNLPLRTTYASGKWKENVYDSQRRLTGMLYSSPDMDYELQLDDYGRTTQASNGVVQTAYVLNSAGGVTNEVRMMDNSADTIARTFDGADRLIGLSVCGDGYEQCLAYSTNGLLTTISNSDAVVAYDYSGDLKDIGYVIAFADGGMFTRTLSRDPFRRDLVLSITNACGLSSHGIDYSYDALSRPVSRNGDTFAYNERSEVVEATVGGNFETHDYDAIGNPLLATFNAETNTYTVNNVNQYTSVLCDSASLRETIYDTDGNLTNDGVFSYSYNAENRLVSVSSNEIVLVANQYDHKGRRIRKTTPTSETTFLYDDWNLIYEREIAGATTNETFYYWGKDFSGTLQGAGGVGGLLYLKCNGTIYVPHADVMGNILRYTDTAGNIVASYTYDAFGATISQSGTMCDVFRHRFSTKYYDIETGLYYYGYRFYSPSLMRWLNRDPIEEDGGRNIYGFCGNSSVCKYDKDGRAYFAVRRLKAAPCKIKWSTFFINPLVKVSVDVAADYFNVELVHEHLFFEDGAGQDITNIGWGDEGYLKSVNREDGYTKRDGGYDDCIMRIAVEKVNPDHYQLTWVGVKSKCNCQDYAAALRAKYRELENDPKIKCKCKRGK